jgi:hypothetical protein
MDSASCSKLVSVSLCSHFSAGSLTTLTASHLMAPNGRTVSPSACSEILARILPEGTEESPEIPVRTVGVPADMQRDNLSNESQVY